MAVGTLSVEALMPLYDPPPSDPKAARFYAVARAVVDVLVQHGPDAVTVSTISRRSGVSRAWIYKQFGTETQALLDFTFRELGGLVAGLDLRRNGADLTSWRADIVAATRVGLRHAEVAPWGASLYFRYRNAGGVLGEAVRAVEDRHVRQFIEDLPAELSAPREQALTFARVFATARLGVYVWWADPAARASSSEDAVISVLLGMLDGFVASKAARRS
jgi:AcrR family transcriptional regulator